MDKLLYLLEKNPRLTNAELAVMLGLTEEEVAAKVRMYEDSGVIKGYRALIDKEKAHAPASYTHLTMPTNSDV